MKHALALLSLCAVVVGCSDDPFFPYYPADAQTTDVAGDTVTLPDGTSGTDAGADTTDDVSVTDASADVAPRPDTGDDVACVPSCGGRECGEDGCGGRCGICSGGESCSEGICVGAATGTCVDIIGCVNTTQCRDQACVNACLETGTPSAQNLFVEFLGCIETTCADSVDPDDFAACQQNRCADEFGACTGEETPGGDATCAEVATCALGCEDAECATECVNDGTPEAQRRATALVNCALEACDATSDPGQLQSCVIEACPEEAFACFGA